MWRAVVVVLMVVILAKSDTVYTRWGRRDCPRGSSIVYKGYTAGSSYTEKSTSAKVICLPEVPTFDEVVDGVQGHSSIYSAEYESSQSIAIVGNLNDHDMPCAVCMNTQYSTSLMVPGRNTCYEGWVLQYYGYLWGGGTNKENAAPMNYICVDKYAQSAGGQQITGLPKVSMYVVESRCGTDGPLPCPPYIDGWELTCAVCAI